jgi:hypothetical protein
MEKIPNDSSQEVVFDEVLDEADELDTTSSSSVEDIINTNNIEPLVDTEGFRRVALNRIIGMDRPYFKDGVDISPRDASLGFKHYEELLYEEVEASEGVVEMTLEQREIVNMVVDEMPAFLKRYGLENPVLVPASAISISDMSNLSDDDREKASTTAAFFSGEEQRVVFNGDVIKSKSNLEFAHILAHELVHLHSFHSLELKELKNDQGKVVRRKIRSRKSGLVNLTSETDTDGGQFLLDNFAQINEALTESLARHFTNTFLDKLPHVEDDIHEIKNELVRMYLDAKHRYPEKRIYVADTMTGLTYGKDSGEGGFDKVILRDSGSYEEEVEILKSTVRLVLSKAKLYQESIRHDSHKKIPGSLHDLLMSFEEEFDVTKFLTQTYFSGKQLNFARLSKFVSGKNFREIGKMTSLIDKRESKNPPPSVV